MQPRYNVKKLQGRLLEAVGMIWKTNIAIPTFCRIWTHFQCSRTWQKGKIIDKVKQLLYHNTVCIHCIVCMTWCIYDWIEWQASIVGARCWAFKLHLPSTYVSVHMYLCACICVCIHIHIQVCEHLAFRKQKLVLDASHGQASCLLRIHEPEDCLQDMLRATTYKR